MIYSRMHRYLSPNDGGGGAPAGGQAEAAKEDAGVDFKAENETLKARVKEMEDKLHEAEERQKAEDRAKMTDAEKRKADAEELERVRQETLKEYRLVNLQKAGLSEEYLPLLAGTTKDEIAESGALVQRLVEAIRTSTEAEVKKGLARTGAPGTGAGSGELDPVTFFDSLKTEGRNNG